MNNMNTIIIGGREYSEQDVVKEKEDYVRLEAVDLCFALYALVQDDSPVIRAAVARKKIGHEQLVNDDSWRVRATVARYTDDFQFLDQLLEDENDFVRFVIVKRDNHEFPESEINKASIKFDTEHKRGSLAAMLNVMSDCKLNLTKIQSMPKIETPWKYSFFVDITFENYNDFKKAKSIMAIMSEEFKILGEYKNAKI